MYLDVTELRDFYATLLGRIVTRHVGRAVLELAGPPDAPCAVALVEEDALPLSDGTVDLLLLVHALEMSPQPGRLMGEARRVLAPAGRLLVVAPNRQGAWARFDV